MAELLKHIAQVVPHGDDRLSRAGARDKLRDLVADSVERAEIIALTLEGLDLEIPLHQLVGAESLGDLADRIYRKAVTCSRP